MILNVFYVEFEFVEYGIVNQHYTSSLYTIQCSAVQHGTLFIFSCYLGFKMVIRYRDILEVITVLSNEKELTVTVRLVNSEHSSHSLNESLDLVLSSFPILGGSHFTA
jgi:hypothetical protein